MLADLLSLTGKTALVVGGGGEGIGGHTSRILAEAGAAVAVADVSEEALQAARRMLEGTRQRQALLRADVTREAEVHSMVDEALRAFGRIDILVNVAGGTQASSWGPMLGKTLESGT